MAMALVETVTVGAGGSASISFTGIAGTGKDLLVVLSGRCTAVEAGVRMRFNSDSGSNYSYRMIYGSGINVNNEQATAETGIVAYIMSASSFTNNTFGSVDYYVSNYTRAFSKIITVGGGSENNNSTSYQGIVAGNWNNTSAITAITLVPMSGNFAQHTTASLYIIS